MTSSSNIHSQVKMSSSSENKAFSSPVAGNDRRILVNIKGQGGTVIRSNVNVNLPAERLFRKYCEKRDLEYKSITFLYKGKRINKHSRALRELKFGHKKEVEIDAMEHMPGGG